MNIMDGDKTTTSMSAEDVPTEPIEITIETEGETKEGETKDSKEAGAEGEPKKAAKQSGRYQRKIDQLTARASSAETTAQRLHRENEELRQKLEETATKANTADRAALANYEESVTANLKNAKRSLVDAQNSGDSDKIAEATAEVAKWGAESGNLDRWKKAQPKDEGEGDGGGAQDAGEPEPPRRTEQAPQGPVTLPPLLQKFVDDNPWFAPGSKATPNPEFDLEMHQFARAYGLTLERKYKAEGKEIDQSYYDALAKRVKDAFEYQDDDGEEEPAPKKKTPAMNGDEKVAPARSSSPPARNGNGIQGNKITLTTDERQMAWSMADNGAYKDPKTGKNLTRAEAEVRYARALYKDRMQHQKGT